MMETLKFKIN